MNQNYFKSVVREFFPEATEMYRDSMISKDHLEKYLLSEGKDDLNRQIQGSDQVHSCACNLCGEDINSRASAIA